MRAWLAFLFLVGTASASRSAPDSWLPIEKEVSAIVAGPQVTVVHFWAPWCPNCKAELANDGWSTFLKLNPDVKFVFVTVWNDKDGRDVLEKNGVGSQSNFTLLLHPNASRSKDAKMTSFLDLPVTWIPTTWLFKDGKLRYALNYGELHFPLLQQLIRDSSASWDHK
jgi:thiol-disulfide isomerase/thioredoxin